MSLLTTTVIKVYYLCFTDVVVSEGPVHDDVLGQDSLGLHGQSVGRHLDHTGLQVSHYQIYRTDLTPGKLNNQLAPCQW